MEWALTTSASPVKFPPSPNRPPSRYSALVHVVRGSVLHGAAGEQPEIGERILRVNESGQASLITRKRGRAEFRPRREPGSLSRRPDRLRLQPAPARHIWSI